METRPDRTRPTKPELVTKDTDEDDDEGKDGVEGNTEPVLELEQELGLVGLAVEEVAIPMMCHVYTYMVHVVTQVDDSHHDHSLCMYAWAFLHPYVTFTCSIRPVAIGITCPFTCTFFKSISAWI